MSLKLNDNRGFTLIELLMVMGTLALLMHIAGVSYFDYRQKAFNTRALSDGRHLATVISNSLIDEVDADYTHAPEDGDYLGITDTDGNPRDSLFRFSEGVKARVTGSSSYYAGGQGFFEAYIYHENGGSDPYTDSLKREYMCVVDELSGEIIFSLN